MIEGFALVESRATAAEFHAREVPDPAVAEIWWHEPVAPALVLGSTQSEAIVDRAACNAAGVDVVRRRSGGGAVLLVPGDVTWIDVIVPPGTSGWGSDVHTPMRWLGRHLATLVAEVLPSASVEVHEGPPRVTAWSSLVCFDGIGTGEVLVDGAKLAGISQRRTRHAARLQCCWYSTYDPAALVGLLAAGHRPPVDELAPVATVAGDVARSLVERLAAHLAA